MFADVKSMVMKVWYEHYALLAINCMNLESTHAAIRVVEKNHAPIILSLYQGYLAHFPVPVAAVVVKALAESASIPITLALDHGKSPDCTRQALRAGFSELMIDTPAFPLEENVRQTRAVVELAASAQLCVEGELDRLAGAPRYDQTINTDLMTQPANVESFIAQISINLLTVSVDTAHGMYAFGIVPTTDFQCLVKIFRCSSVSLASHDGSGAPFDQLQLYTTLGVTKINVGAATSERGRSALLHTLCHDISVELVDTPKAMELAFEGTITPYL